MKVPEAVEKIMKQLQTAGFTANLVGGCVRDFLQGKEPSDWDLCTSAFPEETMQVFAEERILMTGLKHGTVAVVTGDAVSGGYVEITTYRTDGSYSDGRHPDSVQFVRDIRQDLARRDFTINAMAWNPRDGLIDPYGGQEDLKAGLLRCVGDPEQRFREDALRILRGLRFLSALDFRPDKATDAAMRALYPLLESISQERITAEFLKFLCGAGAARLLDEYREIICFLIPELQAEIGFDQRSPYHNRDVWQHTLCAVADIPAEPVLRMTMLLHDIAKPVVCVLDDNGRGRFVGHPAKGAEMAQVILRRMRLSGKMTAHIVNLIRYHDAKIRPERTDVRRWLGRLGHDYFYELMKVRHADASGKYEKYLAEAEQKNEKLRILAEEIEASGCCIDIRGLAVSGTELAAAGLRGSQIKEGLEWLLEEVLTERLENTEEVLLSAIESYRIEKGL